MWPTLTDGDRLLVSRLVYRVIPPKRGDIVLLRDPSRPGYECIKRIVALPDEEVELSDASPSGEDGPGGSRTGRRLAADEYFVIGDNLDHSRDSRAFGPVRRGALLGLAWYRYGGRRQDSGLLTRE